MGGISIPVLVYRADSKILDGTQWEKQRRALDPNCSHEGGSERKAVRGGRYLKCALTRSHLKQWVVCVCANTAGVEGLGQDC